MQQQYFAGPVAQVVQAGNLHQYASAVVAPESQLQAEFAQRTGIWCPKPARNWLEQLMEQHHFTAHELGICWKGGSIGWNAEENTQRISTSWTAAVLAYGLVAVLTIYYAAIGIALIATDKTGNPWAMAALLGFGMVYLGVCWMASRFILLPRRIALRVKKKAVGADLHAEQFSARKYDQVIAKNEGRHQCNANA